MEWCPARSARPVTALGEKTGGDFLLAGDVFTPNLLLESLQLPSKPPRTSRPSTSKFYEFFFYFNT